MTTTRFAPMRSTTMPPAKRDTVMASANRPSPRAASPGLDALVRGEEQRAPVVDGELDGIGEEGQRRQPEQGAGRQRERVRRSRAPGLAADGVRQQPQPATTPSGSRMAFAAIAPLPSPQPCLMIAPPITEAHSIPSEKKPWKTDIVGRPRAVSTAEAWVLIATLSAPPIAPPSEQRGEQHRRDDGVDRKRHRDEQRHGEGDGRAPRAEAPHDQPRDRLEDQRSDAEAKQRQPEHGGLQGPAGRRRAGCGRTRTRRSRPKIRKIAETAYRARRTTDGSPRSGQFTSPPCPVTSFRGDGALSPRRRPRRQLERVKGIEPSSSAWKAVALPLSYTRMPARHG